MPPLEDEPVEFEAAFEGPAVDAGRMAAKEFAGSVFALAELIEQSAAVEFDRENAVALEIRADFRHGSFEFWLIAGAVVVPISQHLLTAVGPPDLIALLKHVGVIKGITKNLLALVKRTGANPIEIRTEGDNNTVSVTVINASGQQALIITGVDPAVAKLLQSERVRAALPDVVKPLEVEGIDRLRLGARNDPAFIAEKDDASRFQPPIPHENELTDSVAETALELLAPNFVEGHVWRVAQGGQAFTARVLDTKFIKRVDDGEAFAKGDFLIVALRTRTFATLRGLKVEREILDVKDHIRRERQGRLDGL